MRTTAKPMLLSGNEAIARGAYEAGVKLAAAYPGTPSTEILEALVTYEGIQAQWSPNEKVALDVAFGAALGGVRAMASMKHVGLNVAADSLFTIAYTGSTAGLVVVSADLKVHMPTSGLWSDVVSATLRNGVSEYGTIPT